MTLHGMKPLIIILKMSSAILKHVSIFSFNHVSSKSNLKYADNSGAMKNQYTWWASRPINYICVHIHLYVLPPEGGSLGRWDFGRADILWNRLGDTRHSFLLRWGLSLICSDGTGTPEWSRHPQEAHGTFHQGLKCHHNWKSGQAVSTATSHHM